MDMGEIVKAPRKVAAPLAAPKFDAPIRAPIFTTPERETVAVPVEPRKAE